MASWLIRIDSSSGKSRGRRRAICSGLHARAHRRGCRCPCRRPFHVTTGLGTVAPLGAMIVPANRSCTYRCSSVLIASFAGLGRRAARSACHWAVVARYSKPPDRVAALRRSSREIVDGARASRRAISRTPCPWARQSAICSRSVNARYRPDGGGAEGIRCDAAMPPASRNHRVPTAGDTPALTAASSLECPVAIATQNRRCSSRRRTEGRPGERSFARPARSERLLRVVIATPFGAVLRRPVELRQYLSIRYTERLAEAGIERSVGSAGDSYDNAMAESVIGLFKTEVIRRRGPWRGVEDVEFATLEWVAWYNDARPLAPLGYVPPAEFEQAYYDRQTALASVAVLN